MIIPKNINLIDLWAFDDCISLKSIEFLGDQIINQLDFNSAIHLKKLEFSIDDLYGNLCIFQPSSIVTISAGSEIYLILKEI